MSLSGTRRGYLTPLLAPIGVLGILFAVSETKLSQQLENVTVDWRFNAREPYDPPADPRILLVGIGEYSLKLAGRWPWPREIHAGFLDRLALRNPKVVAYDLLFTEPSLNGDHDVLFGDQLARFSGLLRDRLSKWRTPLLRKTLPGTSGKPGRSKR